MFGAVRFFPIIFLMKSGMNTPQKWRLDVFEMFK